MARDTKPAQEIVLLSGEKNEVYIAGDVPQDWPPNSDNTVREIEVFIQNGLNLQFVIHGETATGQKWMQHIGYSGHYKICYRMEDVEDD